jgi:hypothetical protein
LNRHQFVLGASAARGVVIRRFERRRRRHDDNP